MAKKVAGDLYESITGQLFEIGRQLRQPNGYPFDPERLRIFLQRAVEGRFPSVLMHIRTVSVNGEASFVAADHLKVDEREGSSVHITLLEDGLMARLHNLVEELTGNTELRVFRLGEAVRSHFVINELGGMVTSLIKFSHFFSLIRAQGRGQAGPLLTDGNPNYAYVRTAVGPVEIYATWNTDGGGWLLGTATNGWWSEGQVVSR